MSRLLPALAVLLVTLPALAQAPVRLAPGHPDLATEAVTLASGTFDVALVQPQLQPLGTVAQTVTHHDDGTVSIATVVDIVMGSGGDQVEDTTHFAWPSLTPISHVRVDHNARGDEVESITFDGLHVVGTYQDADAAPVPVDLHLIAPVFGLGANRTVARAVPFEVGYAAVVPVFTAEDRLEEYDLEVVGREDVARPDGETVSAWIVEETTPEGRTRSYAVDPDTRDLLRIAFAPAPGYLVHFVRR